ncbi:MAG: hypothetical protein ACM3ZT_03175 [Bacillota bacterium]
MSAEPRHEAAHRRGHKIEVRLENLRQFFNSMDPSPFYERDLDPDAEHFIVSWAQEFRTREPVHLVLHLESPFTEHQQAMVEEAVHNHFGNEARLARLEFRQLLRVGSRSLAIGLAALAACLLAVSLLNGWDGALVNLLRQSLLIGGWVAMWQPMQIYLYGWWPLRRRRRIYEKLAHMPVELTTAAHPPAARHASSP